MDALTLDSDLTFKCRHSNRRQQLRVASEGREDVTNLDLERPSKRRKLANSQPTGEGPAPPPTLQYPGGMVQINFAESGSLQAVSSNNPFGAGFGWPSEATTFNVDRSTPSSEPHQHDLRQDAILSPGEYLPYSQSYFAPKDSSIHGGNMAPRSSERSPHSFTKYDYGVGGQFIPDN